MREGGTILVPPSPGNVAKYVAHLGESAVQKAHCYGAAPQVVRRIRSKPASTETQSAFPNLSLAPARSRIPGVF
jgi:hypothetical protein